MIWGPLMLTVIGNVLAGLVAGAVTFCLQRPTAEKEAAQLKTPVGMVLLSRSLRMWGYYLIMLVLLAASILSWASIWCAFMEASTEARLNPICHDGLIVLSWLFYIFPVAYLILFQLGLRAIIAFEKRCQAKCVNLEMYSRFFRSLILRPTMAIILVLSLESAGFILASKVFGIEGLAPLHALVNYSSLFIFGLAWLISLFLSRSPRILEIFETM